VPLLEVRGMMALPAGWELAAAIIVLHSLIELGAMTAYLWWVPTRLVPFDSLG
jgi:hypothetical protein